jgi:hypothetical protein
VDFSAFLVSKKIDEQAFRSGEPVLFNEWLRDFGQMHPNSFTMQKLNLINPVRRKYPLKASAVTAEVKTLTPPTTPKIAKPVFKPKIN